MEIKQKYSWQVTDTSQIFTLSLFIYRVKVLKCTTSYRKLRYGNKQFDRVGFLSCSILNWQRIPNEVEFNQPELLRHSEIHYTSNGPLKRMVALTFNGQRIIQPPFLKFRLWGEALYGETTFNNTWYCPIRVQSSSCEK